MEKNKLKLLIHFMSDDYFNLMLLSHVEQFFEKIKFSIIVLL